MILKPEQIDAVEPTIKSTRVICLALIVGVAIANITIFAFTNWNLINTKLDGIGIVVLACGILMYAMSFVIPDLITCKQPASKTDQQRLLRLANDYQRKTLVQYSLLEGAAFMNLILFLVTQNVLLLGMVVLALVQMIAVFPKLDSIYVWIGDRLSD